MLYQILFSILLILNLVSCSGKEVRMTVQGASYCLSSKIHTKTPMPSLEKALEQMNDEELQKYFSPKSIRLAIAYGLFSDLKSYVKLIQSNKNKQEIDKIENKFYRTSQLMVMDIDSTTSEYNCYVDRFTEILTMMKEKEEDIVQSNTLYAIMSGAFAAILDGSTVYDTGTNQLIILAGGLLVSYFSYRAFTPRVTIEFKPRSTNLKEIWFNTPTSENYSTSLWFILTQNLIKTELCIRDLLVKRWVENNFLGEESEREAYVDLFFGKGGVSTITHITNRREMNNEVRSMVNLLLQDVKGLQIEFINLKEKTP